MVFRRGFPTGLSTLAALFILATPFPVAAAELPVLAIRFQDNPVVDGPAVRLGEIARITAADGKSVAALESLEVAKAASFGLTRVFDTEGILVRFLKPYSSRYLIDLERKSIRLTTRFVTLPADTLSALLEAFLGAQPAAKGRSGPGS